MTDDDDRTHHRAPRAEPSQTGMDQGMAALSYLIAGVLVWGGGGWLADHLLHTGFFLPIGIVVGAGLGCYMIIARFGALPGRSATASASPSGAVEPGVGTTGERQHVKGEEGPWVQ